MISVIVPIYKVEKYIKRCIESLISQDLKDFEIILVDDGSPDNCPEICDEYASKDNRIKVVHKENGGLVSARKAGLAVSNGEYIGFVDSDDFVEGDMFFEFDSIIKEFKPDMILAEFINDYGDKTEKSSQNFEEGFYDKEKLKEKIYPVMLFNGTYYHFGVNPGCWCKIYKRELLEKNLKFVDDNTRMGEDAAFTYPCLLDAQSVYCVKNAKYHYIINTDSMSRAYDKKLKDIIFFSYERIKFKNKEASCNISNQLNYYLLYMVNFLVRNESKAESTLTKKEKKKMAEDLLNNKDIEAMSEKLDFSVLPLHTKMLAFALKKKSRNLILLYSEFLKIYLKG